MAVHIWLGTFLCFPFFKFAYLPYLPALKYGMKQPGVVRTKDLLKNHQKLTKILVHDYGYEISGANYSLDVEIYARLYHGHLLPPQTERPYFIFSTRIFVKGHTQNININLAKFIQLYERNLVNDELYITQILWRLIITRYCNFLAMSIQLFLTITFNQKKQDKTFCF